MQSYYVTFFIKSTLSYTYNNTFNILMKGCNYHVPPIMYYQGKVVLPLQKRLHHHSIFQKKAKTIPHQHHKAKCTTRGKVILPLQKRLQTIPHQHHKAKCTTRGKVVLPLQKRLHYHSIFQKKAKTILHQQHKAKSSLRSHQRIFI